MRIKLIALCLAILLTGCHSFLPTQDEAKFQLGRTAFHQGDYKQAYKRLYPLAVKGMPEAQYAIGYMNYYGRGVIENQKEAMIWFKRAAANGDPHAMEALARLKHTG